MTPPPPPRNPPRRRGTCPGVLAPMEVGDGYLLRVRVPAGVLPADHARRIAGLGQRYGNGLIDLSHRGNLQLRGLTTNGLEPVTEALRAMGYVSEDVAAEAVRNVLCDPTAGLDPAAAMDVRPVALAIDARLAADPAAHALPAKFGWLVSGGGTAHLGNSSADVRFDALDGNRLRVSLGGTLAGAAPLGVCEAGAAPDVVSALGRAFLELRATLVEPSRRMAGLVAAVGIEPFRARLSPLLSPLPPWGEGWGEGGAFAGRFRRRRTPSSRSSPRGEKGKPAWLTVAFPFGRLTCATLAALADLTEEIRITPWRALLLVDPVPTAATIAQSLGGILSADDRRLKLTACSGLHGCDVGTTDTHATALAIAKSAGPLLDRVGMVHVSGCAKGCAHPGAAAVTLTAREGVYDVALNAKPGAAAWRAGLSPDDAVACVAGLSVEELSGA